MEVHGVPLSLPLPPHPRVLLRKGAWAFIGFRMQDLGGNTVVTVPIFKAFAALLLATHEPPSNYRASLTLDGYLCQAEPRPFFHLGWVGNARKTAAGTA